MRKIQKKNMKNFLRMMKKMIKEVKNLFLEKQQYMPFIILMNM
jgi:hypothetical protein